MTGLVLYLAVGVAGALVAVIRNRHYIEQIHRVAGTLATFVGLLVGVLATAVAWPVVWPVCWWIDRASARGHPVSQDPWVRGCTICDPELVTGSVADMCEAHAAEFRTWNADR